LDAILMPQSKMRQKVVFDQTAPDGGNDLSYVYSSCGGSIDYCNDDYRYWPAFRKDALDILKINKFEINATLGCKRWASAPIGETARQASDEGDWIGHTIDENYAMMNIANPGFSMSDSTDANRSSPYMEMADYDSNYLNAFLSDYAPGWSSTCVKNVAASFRGYTLFFFPDPDEVFGGNPYDLAHWGYFENISNEAERANIQYGGHYGADICGGIFTFVPDSNDFYVGGWVPPIGDDAQAGYNWKDPSSSNNWREPDVCSEWPHYDPNPFVSVEGGIENVSDRINRTSHCFKCKNGRYFLDGVMVADTDEKCFSICEADYGGVGTTIITDNNDWYQGYFINEGIFYESSALSSEIQ